MSRNISNLMISKLSKLIYKMFKPMKKILNKSVMSKTDKMQTWTIYKYIPICKLQLIICVLEYQFSLMCHHLELLKINNSINYQINNKRINSQALLLEVSCHKWASQILRTIVR